MEKTSLKAIKSTSAVTDKLMFSRFFMDILTRGGK
jgi:hypothetical protein